MTLLIHGRGASANPANRFEKLHVDLTDVVDVDPAEEEERPRGATRYFRDRSKTIITRNNSPDVGFETSVNPYRGCEHGCIYCYARPTHEYLGFSAGLDFESKIMVKTDAPELLRAELESRHWQPQVIVMSGVTDPYQPVEKQLRITRGCLEVLAKFRNPVAIITKNRLVTRDVDLLQELAKFDAAAVNISITSLDPKLQRVLEPRTSSPEARLEAVKQLRAAGIPVGVMVAPIIPGLTDHEAPKILEACAQAGAQFAGYTIAHDRRRDFCRTNRLALRSWSPSRGHRRAEAAFDSFVSSSARTADFVLETARCALSAEAPSASLRTGSARRPYLADFASVTRPKIDVVVSPKLRGPRSTSSRDHQLFQTAP